MNFRAEFFPKPFEAKINYRDPLFLIGSCFTEEIGQKLIRHKFNVLQNPSGILFNPASISSSIMDSINDCPLKEDDIFHFNELWHSWKHHSRFSHPEKEALISATDNSRHAARAFLQNARWVMVTLGSAFVYETTNEVSASRNRVVANCHKVPTDRFNRRLLSVEEVAALLKEMMDRVLDFNPEIRFIFTISPVRHLREGFIENNRSKATLIQAVHSLTDNRKAFYFPAYELVIDDLRDYRFYAEDLAHPNYAATQYVWEKFIPACLDEESQKLLADINSINAARSHKPFNPGSNAHRQFLQTNLERVKKLKSDFDFLNLDEEFVYFGT